MKTYKYRMKSRPAGIGCQPMEGMINIKDLDKKETGYWSEITYNRKLTETEIKKYELKEIE